MWIWIFGLIHIWIQMSPELFLKSCGFMMLSVSARFFHAMLCISMAYAVARCMSVCRSCCPSHLCIVSKGVIILINGDGGCRFWQPVQADSQPKSSGLVLGRRPLGALLHSSNEPVELSQWLCHDDSTINIVLDIIIISLQTHCWITMYPTNFMCLSRPFVTFDGIGRTYSDNVLLLSC